MKRIELIGVNKSFKEERVLKDICLTLGDNKIYGFVGRNGSGKSVLFKIICGMISPRPQTRRCRGCAATSSP